jgi:two-component system chemotaxis response regulator CheB
MEARSTAVVIGASAGALEALSVILPVLPADFGRAILVVVHLPPDRKSLLAELLGDTCRLRVREAEDKEPIVANTVYLAPPDYHLLVETDRYLSLSNEEPVHFSRPSIDILFTTAAAAFKSDLIGIILSGANQDGAEGLRAVELAGGLALVQRPDLASSPEMPQAALAACSNARALSLDGIAAVLCEAAMQ